MTKKDEHSLRQLLAQKRLVVCCGSGGVGKTTTASALALMASFLGRRTLVLTIDPARRLANSLGLESLENVPRDIDLESIIHLAPRSVGRFQAMMLDPKATLDDLMRRLAPDAAAAEKILKNRIYRLFAGTLHGTQEYAALEKLFDLYDSGQYDIIILDTPPTQNALEFFNTPGHMSRFLDESVMRWFLPAISKSHGLFERFLKPGALVVGLMGKMLGQQFVGELVEFFGAIAAMRKDFRGRTVMVEQILRDEDTAFVIVTSPDQRRMDEALFFHRKLEALDQRTAAFIVNRTCTDFTLDQIESLPEDAFLRMARSLTPRASKENLSVLFEQLRDYYGRLARLAAQERQSITALAGQVGQRMLHLVPLLADEVNSLEDLLTVGEYLLMPPALPDNVV